MAGYSTVSMKKIMCLLVKFRRALYIAGSRRLKTVIKITTSIKQRYLVSYTLMWLYSIF